MKAILFTLLLSSVAIFSGCDSTENRSQAFFRFVEQVEETYKKDPMAIDWVKTDRRYDDYLSFYEKQKSRMSKEERIQVNHYIGRYNALMIKTVAQDLMDEIDDLGGQVEGFIKELLEENVE